MSNYGMGVVCFLDKYLRNRCTMWILPLYQLISLARNSSLATQTIPPFFISIAICCVELINVYGIWKKATILMLNGCVKWWIFMKYFVNILSKTLRFIKFALIVLIGFYHLFIILYF